MFFFSALQRLKNLEGQRAGSDSKAERFQTTMDAVLATFPDRHFVGLHVAMRIVHETLLTLVRMLLSEKMTTEKDALLLNRFLQSDCVYILRDFANGSGDFLDLINDFIKGLIWGVFSHRNNFLMVETIEKFGLNSRKKKDVYDETFIQLASRQWNQCAEGIRDFKESYPEYAGKSGVSATIVMMERFIVSFYYYLSKKDSSSAIFSIATQVPSFNADKAREISDGIEAQVQFMAELEETFGVSYGTPEMWLQALVQKPSTVAHWVSEKTGDTMLHALTRMPAIRVDSLLSQVKNAVLTLKRYKSVRNHRNETPMMALTLSDPYQILSYLDDSMLVDIGNNFSQIETFLNAIHKTPSLDGHFLLLDGPPGVGKTSAVLRYLNAEGYCVSEWVRNTEQDSSLGGLDTRIRAFFETVKEKSVSTGLQVLFIDEIDSVIPELVGLAQAAWHSRTQEVGTFLTCISALRQKRVALIGATNYLDRLAKPMISRAGTNYIYFPLPTESQRLDLIKHFFVKKP